MNASKITNMPKIDNEVVTKHLVVKYYYYDREKTDDLYFSLPKYDFLIPLSASPNLLLGDKMTFGIRGAIYPVLPNVMHGIKGRMYGLEFYELRLSDTLLEEVLASKQIEHIDLSQSFVATKLLFNLINDIFVAKESKDDGLLEALALAIVHELVNSLVNPLKDPLILTAQMDERIMETIEYISNHYNENLSIPFLSKRLNYSNEHFIRLFKQETNETPIAFITRLRLSKAKELFQTTDYSTEKIAAMTGFCSANSLSVLIRKHYHISIKELRKRKRTHTS